MSKKCQIKYGKLPHKLVITVLWEALCVNLIGPYTLRGKEGSEIDFMCLTMINPASSWFEIVELPVFKLEALTSPVQKGKGNKHKTTKAAYFNKSSSMVSTFVNTNPMA